MSSGLPRVGLFDALWSRGFLSCTTILQASEYYDVKPSSLSAVFPSWEASSSSSPSLCGWKLLEAPREVFSAGLFCGHAFGGKSYTWSCLPLCGVPAVKQLWRRIGTDLTPQQLQMWVFILLWRDWCPLDGTILSACRRMSQKVFEGLWVASWMVYPSVCTKFLPRSLIGRYGHDYSIGTLLFCLRWLPSHLNTWSTAR